MLIDSDPQGSSRDWGCVNADQPVEVIGIDRPTFKRDLKNFESKDFVIIDGAPQSEELAVAAITVSDFVVLPVQPSPYDIWAVSELVSLIKQRIEITDGKLKAAFLITRSIKGTKLGVEVREALSEFELPVFQTAITQRVIFPTSASLGSTVLDQDPNSESSKEINSFVDELLIALN